MGENCPDGPVSRHAWPGQGRRQLARIDTAGNALITELETPARPADPAAQALRNRIRARFTQLYTERTRIETELAAPDAATTQDNDPTLRSPPGLPGSRRTVRR
jgi:hypothetical protein